MLMLLTAYMVVYTTLEVKKRKMVQDFERIEVISFLLCDALLNHLSKWRWRERLMKSYAKHQIECLDHLVPESTISLFVSCIMFIWKFIGFFSIRQCK